MSAPTPAPGDDRPREGYYPDPSIPGYVRYWNGAAWVPGTSRPAPADGEPLSPPPGARPAQAAAPALEETGPHFFDEDPVGEPGPGGAAAHDVPSEPAVWGADPARQSGFAGDPDHRVSWGAQAAADPRLPQADGPDGRATAAPADQGQGQGQAQGRFHGPEHGQMQGQGQFHGPEQGAGQGPSQGPDQSPGQVPAESDGTFVFRRPTAADGPGEPGNPPAPGIPGPGGPRADEGTMTFRPVPGPARRGGPGGAPGTASVPAQGSPLRTGPVPHDPAGGPDPAGAPGYGAGKAAAARASAAHTHGQPPAQVPGQAQGQPPGQMPSQAQGQPPSQMPAQAQGQPPGQMPAQAQGQVPGQGPAHGTAGHPGQGHAPGQAAPAAGPAAARSAPPDAGPQVPASALPQQSGAPQPLPTPVTSGAGGGQASWAQQVHQLAGAGEDQPVVPWKPPVEDLFQAAARRQAEARPAGLGRRLAARLVDSVVLAGVTAVAAVPLGTKVIDHVDGKIDAAKLSGRTVTVWLLDGTTATYLGGVLAVLLVFGALYEALPTAKWGRTLGKKLCGLQVRDIEGHEPPSLGAALRRWLVYSVPGLLGVGLLGVLWCLFDRPWRQCWHDKAAHTFVAG
ncbi:RDD family protein [Streptomyces sp. NPDC015220]|uniref:RDD family protein n=1 Tax=Streptomyces sp. NPDC015220 TaxID=3364947 RepID=UPI0037029EC8